MKPSAGREELIRILAYGIRVPGLILSGKGEKVLQENNAKRKLFQYLNILYQPLLLFSILPLTVIAQSGNFWDTKDYRKWSEKECRKLLESSPWANEYTITQILIEPLQNASTERAREQRPEIKYQAQLRSALPIRQALVRLSQINQKYDQLSPEQKQTFDKQTDEFLTRQFPDTVILYVQYSSNVQFDDRDLVQYWRKQTTDTLKNFVFLIGSDGRKIPLQKYTVGDGAKRDFQFVFPREYEGRPLVTAQDKSLKLEFQHPQVGGHNPARVLIDFKVEKMVTQGQVVY